MRRVVAVLLAPVLAACTQGAKSGRRLELPPVPDPLPIQVAAVKDPLPVLPSGPERIEGSPSIRVTWEALAVERERYEHPSPFAPRGTKPFVSADDLEIVLLNASYVATPEQDRENKSQPPTGRIARVSDADMNALVDPLNQLGFFQYANETSTVRGLFASDRARGRITVDRGDQSWTLLSLRGLGLQAETRAIPQIYAAAKEVVSRLKNTAPNLRVKGGTIGDRDASRAKAAGTPPAATAPVPAGGGVPGSGSTTGGSGK
jgi:hypothetical protein